MGSTNFLQFDPNAINMIGDAAYSSSNYRINGVVPGQAASTIHNKLFYQTSTMSAALGQVLADAGFTVADNNINALIAAMKAYFATPTPLLYFHGSGPPVWTTGTTFTMSHVAEVDSTGLFVINRPTSLSFNAATVGLNGLDQGSLLAGPVHYYAYAVSDGQSGDTHNGVMLSTIDMSVTGQPSKTNFNWQYIRQLDWAYTTLSNATFIPIIVIQLGFASFIKYITYLGDGVSAGTTNILNAGTSGSYVDVDCSAWLPSISQLPYLKIKGRCLGGNLTIWVRQKGDTSAGTQTQDNNDCFPDIFDFIATDNNRNVQYKVARAGGTIQGAYIDVGGYWVTKRL